MNCDETVLVFSEMSLALITKILHTYLLFYIWSLYIYEIKKHIYCHKFEKKYCWEPTQSRKMRSSQSSFMWQSMEGECNVYALFPVNAPIIRMLYSVWDRNCQMIVCAYVDLSTNHACNSTLDKILVSLFPWLYSNNPYNVFDFIDGYKSTLYSLSLEECFGENRFCQLMPPFW